MTPTSEAIRAYVKPLRHRMANQRKALRILEKQNSANKALFYQHAARADEAERLLAEARAVLSDFVTNYADMQDGDGNEAPELARARAILSTGGVNG